MKYYKYSFPEHLVELLNKAKWPNEFCQPVRVGDHIQGTILDTDFKTILSSPVLRVGSITHAIDIFLGEGIIIIGLEEKKLEE